MAPSGSRKRQQQICFRSLALPPTESDGEETKKKDPDYCPHFLAALQLVAHVMIPLRKALIHFYISYRNKDVQKLEWLTLLAFGSLFRDLITTSNSSGNSVLSGGSSSNNPGSLAGSESALMDLSSLQPVSSECFFPVLYTCLLKHDLQKWPRDATEAIRVLLDCLKCCSQTLPVTNHLWSALLDKACLGLIASQSLVGRRKIESADQKEVVQRSYTEQVILWCPHVLSINDVLRISNPLSPPTTKESDNDGDEDAVNVPTLHQLLEADFWKRPLSTTLRSYYDFEKKSFDFEVQIPTKFLDKKDVDEDLKKNDGEETSCEVWKINRSMQFSSLTGYLFLGIDRTSQAQEKRKYGKFNRSELSISATLDLTKLCSKKCQGLNQEAVYELVGGALYDEGEYIAVLKDFSAVAAVEEKNRSSSKTANSSVSEDDEEETWKLMESEETIPMSESDVLEFLKGEGTDDDEEEEDDDSGGKDEDYGPCGTLAIYKLKSPSSGSKIPCIFDEMNQLLSDIVISQVSGSLNSKTDYYIEEEYEEEIIED